MDRRAALGLLGATAAVVVTPGDLTDWGRAIHRRLGASAGRRVLDPHQDATVVALTDLIVPATDTPGARAARVNEFIDLLLAEWYDAEDRGRFLAGLAEVDVRARAAFAKDFVAGTPQQQAALLSALDAEAAQWSARAEAERGAEPFYRRIRWLTLFGYYTSEIGAGQEQHYAIIPGHYVPCAPVGTLTAPE
jgi:hypothetical protein